MNLVIGLSDGSATEGIKKGTNDERHLNNWVNCFYLVIG